MRPQLFFCAIFALCGAAAFGCASTGESSDVHTASYPKAPTRVAQGGGSGAHVDSSPLNHAREATASADPHAHGPISLTGGEGPYAQRYDPSGWSGSSTPPNGIGGGPNAEENSENPYDEGATTPQTGANGGGTAAGLAPNADALTPNAASANPPQKQGENANDSTSTPPTTKEAPQKDLQEDLQTTPPDDSAPKQ